MAYRVLASAAALLIALATPALAEDLRPSKVHAYDARLSGQVLLCPTIAATVRGYDLTSQGKPLARTKGCTVVPDGADVMVDCNKYSRQVARIIFGRRSGFTSAEQLDESCAPR